MHISNFSSNSPFLDEVRIDRIRIENDKEADIHLYGNRAFPLTRPIDFPLRKGNWVGTAISLRGWGRRARIRRHGIFSKFKFKRT